MGGYCTKKFKKIIEKKTVPKNPKHKLYFCFKKYQKG